MSTAQQLHTPIKGPEAYSDEWYRLRIFDPQRKRPVIIGASEAAAACNVSPWSSALELYLIKRGEFKKEFSDDQTFRMSVGTALEPLILDAYSKRTGASLTRGMPLYFHPQWEFMAATPDALGYSEDPDGPDFEEWCVDAKSTNFRMLDKTGSDDADKYGEDGTDQVPLSNLFQAQQQMAVMGLSRCDFPVLIDNSELRIYTVPRNEDLIKQIALAEAELVERIINADPPEPNYEHSGTKKLLQSMFGTEIGTVAQLSEEDHDLWTRREQLKQAEKMIKEECEEIDSRLAFAMKEAEIGRFPDASIELKKITVAEAEVKAYIRKPYSYLRARKY